jgi:hypothetical protein
MKNFLLFAIGVLFLAYSCQNDTLEGVNALSYDEDVVLEQSIMAFKHYIADDVAIPVAKRSNGKSVTKTIVFHNSSGTGSLDPNPGDCGGISPPLQFKIEGGGTATHLGLYTVVNQACFDLGSMAIIPPLLGFITAANGNEVHTEMGMPYPDVDNPPNFYFPYTIIGGTGRFDGATGHIDMYGTVNDQPPFDWNLSGVGEITY